MRNVERGQILLIVVLVMTIALTVGLSIATRTITDIRTSTEQESSQRAFFAAEAGIEKAMQESSGTTGSFTGNSASYKTSVATVSGVTLFLNNGVSVLKDEAVDVWLSSYPGYTNPWSNEITIYWGSTSDSCTTDEATNSMAALEIVIIAGTKLNPLLTHYPVDPCNARRNVNRFELISASPSTIDGKQYAFKKTITVASGLLMRIIPFYAPTTIVVKGCNTSGAACKALPPQGKLVTAVGTSDNTQRKIVGYQENPKLPVEIFPFMLFSAR